MRYDAPTVREVRRAALGAAAADRKPRLLALLAARGEAFVSVAERTRGAMAIGVAGGGVANVSGSNPLVARAPSPAARRHHHQNRHQHQEQHRWPHSKQPPVGRSRPRDHAGHAQKREREPRGLGLG